MLGALAARTGAPAPLAGLANGGTPIAIHIVGINVTGVSVNQWPGRGPTVASSSIDGEAY